MTAAYAKCDRSYLAEAVAGIEALLTKVNQNARNWSAGHHVVKLGDAPVAVVPVNGLEPQPA